MILKSSERIKSYILNLLIFPFWICDLAYGLGQGSQNCLSLNYGVGISMQAWLISTGFLGFFIFGMIIGAIIYKVRRPLHKDLWNKTFRINLMLIIFRYLGYNWLGLAIYVNISSDDLNNCTGSGYLLFSIFIFGIILALAFYIYICYKIRKFVNRKISS